MHKCIDYFKVLSIQDGKQLNGICEYNGKEYVWEAQTISSRKKRLILFGNGRSMMEIMFDQCMRAVHLHLQA